MKIELADWAQHMTAGDITCVKAAFGPTMQLTQQGLMALEGKRFDAYSIARYALDKQQYDCFWAAHLVSTREMSDEVGQAALNMSAVIENARERLSLSDLLPIVERERRIYDSLRAEWQHKHYRRMVSALLGHDKNEP